MAPRQSATPSRSALQSNRSSSPNSFSLPTINESEVKFKIASCHFALNESKPALAEMEGIPTKARNLEMSLLLGKLYRNSKHNRAAVAIYKECLRDSKVGERQELVETVAEKLKLIGIAMSVLVSIWPLWRAGSYLKDRCIRCDQLAEANFNLSNSSSYLTVEGLGLLW